MKVGLFQWEMNAQFSQIYISEYRKDCLYVKLKHKQSEKALCINFYTAIALFKEPKCNDNIFNDDTVSDSI